MTTDQRRRPQTERSTVSLIASHGFAVNSIGYGACDVPGCHCGVRIRNPWTYTIGLAQIGQPELVLMGLEPEPAHFVISWVANEGRAGRPVPLDEPVLLDGVGVKVLSVPDEWVLGDRNRMAAWFAHFGAAESSMPLPEIRQVVWPDAAGRFPDDPRCAEWVVREQPLLRDAPLHYPKRSAGPAIRHQRRGRPASDT
jgi:hypothetical protein